MASKLSIIIQATNQASGALNQVRRDIGALDTGVRRLVSGGLEPLQNMLSSTLKFGALAATGAIAAVGAMALKTGMDFNRLREQSTIAFTTMLGSGEKAESFLKDLQAFAAKTPFEFPELVKSSQRLLAMGFSAESVLPTLTSIGDAVAAMGGSGEMVGRLTTAIGQIKAKGKASAEEMLQLTEAGIPAWEMLAQKVGKSVSETMDAVSDGQIDAATTIDALISGINGRFGGMMEKQSHTFAGLWSTIKDTFTQISGGVLRPFFEMVTRGLQKIVDFTNSPRFVEGVARLTKWFENLAEKIGNFASSPGFQRILSGLAAFVVMVRSTIATIVQWVGNNVDLRDVLLGLGAVLASVVLPMISSLATSLAPVVAVIGGAVLAARLLRTAWESDFGGIRTAISNFVDWFNQTFGFFIGLLRAHWRIAANELKNFLAGNIQSMAAFGRLWGAATESIRRAYGDIVAYFQAKLPQWTATLKGWATAAWQWIADTTPLVLAKLAEWGAAIWGWIRATAPQVVSSLALWGVGLWAWITEAMGKGMSALAGYVRALAGWIASDGTSTLGSGLESWVGALWRWIPEKAWPLMKPAIIALGQGLLDLLASIGTLIVSAVRTWVPALWQWIVETTPVVLAKLAALGAALWGWLKAKAPEVGVALKGWAAAAWQWIVDVTPVVLGKLAGWAAALWEWLRAKAPEFGAALGGWAAAAWQWIENVTPVVIGKLAEWGGAIWNWLGAHLPDLLKQTALWAVGLWAWITEAMGKGMSALAGYVRSLTEWIKGGGASEIGSGLKSWVSALWRWIQDDAWPLMKPAMLALGRGLLDLVGAIGGLLWEGMKQVGVRVWEGFKAGIQSQWERFKSWWSSLPGSILSTVKSIFGIASPSAVFAEIGENLVQGMIEGVRSSADELARTLRNDLYAPVVEMADLRRSVAGGLLENVFGAASEVAQALRSGSTEMVEGLRAVSDDLTSALNGGLYADLYEQLSGLMGLRLTTANQAAVAGGGDPFGLASYEGINSGGRRELFTGWQALYARYNAAMERQKIEESTRNYTFQFQGVPYDVRQMSTMDVAGLMMALYG